MFFKEKTFFLLTRLIKKLNSLLLPVEIFIYVRDLIVKLLLMSIAVIMHVWISLEKYIKKSALKRPNGFKSRTEIITRL